MYDTIRWKIYLLFENQIEFFHEKYLDLLYRRYHLLWPRRGLSADDPELRDWCTERFGKPALRPSLRNRPRWILAGCAIYFRDSDDAIEFKMRWG